jgi:hypothetical protein
MKVVLASTTMKDDSYLQAQQEQEYQEWLYEMATIDEINKELNRERNIQSTSGSPESFCPSFKDQRESVL